MANQVSETIRETAMVDLTYELLKDRGEPMLYRNIMKEIAQMKGFTDEEVRQYIAQLYTEINIDGRFVCVGRSLWGLRDWYPIEQSTDSVVAANIKENDLDEELEEEPLFDGEEGEGEVLVEDLDESYEDQGLEDVEDDDED